ncbi:hypothetical protein [Eubacterium sp. AB3007]|nr:hypothetical protein [Eubacterium sp. AB3007]
MELSSCGSCESRKFSIYLPTSPGGQPPVEYDFVYSLRADAVRPCFVEGE